MKNGRNSWTIGRKIGLGFGVVVVALGVVGGWSIIGFNGIVDNLHEAINCNVIVSTLAQREIDHLNWAKKVSDLLTDDTITKLEVQVDPKQCAFGKWYYSEECEHAGHLIPELEQALAAIEEPHARLHESATEIGKVFKQADASLPGLLAEKIGDHLKWSAAVRDAFLQKRDSLNVQTDPSMCAFGKWLTSDQAKKAYAHGDAEFKHIWDQMLVGHEKLHESAVDIEKNLAHEEVATAHKAMHEAWSDGLKIADEFFAALETAMEQVIDPAKTKAEEAQDVKAMVKWGEIDMEMNEGVIQPFLAARIALGTIASEGYSDEAWKDYEDLFNECTDGVETWLKLVKDNKTLKETANKIKALCAAWAADTDKYHQALLTQRDANTSLEVARKVFAEQTLPLLDETLTCLCKLKTEAEHELQGMNQANAVFANKVTPALRDVQRLLSQMAKEAQKTAETENENIEAQASSTRLAVILVSVISSVTGIFLAIFIIRGIVKVLTRITSQLNDGADQVNDAAAQVSSSSQQLAEGASEQASSLEETSSALEEMAAMTRTNAANAKEANELAVQARKAADEGDRTMHQLNEAMAGINDSSGKISKIIKVIEEIAFQTNLLALNAAVEAARAGEHGKGFAVVADEVRNLAQRAAQAARETTGLIEDSVNNAQQGTQVAGDVGKALGAIVNDVTKVTELINGIAQASDEQAQGVDQVNTAVSQMDKVTQQNAAGAEESASASEEMAAQAQAVKGMVNELAALVGGKNTKAETCKRDTASKTNKSFDVKVTGKQLQHKSKPVTCGIGSEQESSKDFLPVDDDAKDMKEF